MALYKRDGFWWIDISHQGRRVRKSTGTQVKKDAQQYHDQIKSDMWRYLHLNEKPQKAWTDAVTRWFAESKHKRTLGEDKQNLRWAHPYLHKYMLCDIEADTIEEIAKAKEATGVTPATVNRLLAIIRSILRKAKYEWEWISNVPKIRFRQEANQRIRWLTANEASRLLHELPEHLQDTASFTLATGLRASNVTGLCWKDVDMQREHALIHPEQSKSKKAIPIPLNEDAINILKKQMGKHAVYVFTYKNQPLNSCNTRAWKKALSRANISDFRWHDLRHTWASWHVQNGTTLQELQQLGGWSNFDMVLRLIAYPFLKKESASITTIRKHRGWRFVSLHPRKKHFLFIVKLMDDQNGLNWNVIRECRLSKPEGGHQRLMLLFRRVITPRKYVAQERKR